MGYLKRGHGQFVDLRGPWQGIGKGCFWGDSFFLSHIFICLFLPYSNKKCYFSSSQELFSFRSSTDGNCLYGSISLSLFGDDSMKADLIILSSCERFLHNNYYCKHPAFLNFVEKYNIPLSQAFKFSVSLSTQNFDLPLRKLVRKEGMKNCVGETWTSFLRILALSLVCNRSISSLYPGSGEKVFGDLLNSAISSKGRVYH